MAKLKLTIITPKNVALEKEVDGATLPTSDGEITVLPHHANLFSLLTEGVVRYWNGDNSEYLAIGGGYLETDGTTMRLLVSRAYGQDQIDEKQTLEAITEAKERMKNAKTEDVRQEISSILRRSLVDAKLLKKKRRQSSV